MRIDVKHVGNIAKIVGKVAASVAVLALLPRAIYVENIVGDCDCRATGYYDAVRTIAESTMFASDKREAIAVLKHDGDAEYYKTVISIIKTNMFASEKIAMIKML